MRNGFGFSQGIRRIGACNAQKVFSHGCNSFKTSAMLEILRERAARYPKWTLAVVTLAALLPFLAKPFNIDDPLFVWAARQIHAHPGNPYGFYVEWGYQEFPMSQVTENPPLACYYLAAAAIVVGWGEVGLHLAFLLPAIAVILGIHRLARRLCQSPGLAALLTLFTPVFLVSATTVMCDVLMLAFWIWAVVFWLEGMERKNFGLLAAGGLLVSLAFVSKYFGASLIPLLAAHGLISNRRLGRWALVLLIPIAAVCAYQLATHAIYGRGLFGAAAHYASVSKAHYGFSKLSAGVIGLAFTGGCVAIGLLFAPLIWRPTWTNIVAAGICAIIVFLLAGVVFRNYPNIQSGSRALVEVQLIFWALGGLSVLALAMSELWRRPTAESWLLALWVWGTFIFAALVNWTVNGRSILPLVPAVTILIARRLEEKTPARLKFTALCLAAAACISLLVTGADVSQAGAVWNVADKVSSKYNQAPGSHWFQGHWGFQYYMEQFGWSAEDFKSSELKLGDIIAVPSDNSNVRPPTPSEAVVLESVSANRLGWFATMDGGIGAGFYSSIWGPLPFAFGYVPPQRVDVYRSGSPPVAAPQNPK